MLETKASKAFNNRTAHVDAFGGFDFTADELDLHLLDHAKPGTTLKRPQLNPIELSWSDAFKVMVVWTVRGKDFVCVEPWTAQGGAIAKDDGLLWVAPNAQRSLRFQFRLPL